MFRTKILTILMAVLCLAGSLSGKASAHPMQMGRVDVSVQDEDWHLDLILPADRLEAAFIQAKLVPDPGLSSGEWVRPSLSVAAVERYVLDRINARDAAGKKRAVEVASVTTPSQEADEWHVQVLLRATGDQPGRQIILDYDVLVREIATQQADFYFTSDWKGGFVLSPPYLMGSVRSFAEDFTLARPEASFGTAFGKLFLHGAQHILHGYDHLTFLFLLVLTVPFRSSGGRWLPEAGITAGIRKTAGRISLFTLGHMSALILVIAGFQPRFGSAVEVLIAVSIGLTALHAIRPIFAGIEGWLAAIFGVIHGFAFAGSMTSLNISSQELFSAVLAFNLGIEVTQILLVLPVLLSLFTVRRFAVVSLIRPVLGTAGLAAAVFWSTQSLPLALAQAGIS